MAIMSGGQYTLLQNRLAGQTRLEMAQLQQLTLSDLRALWRAVNNERDRERAVALTHKGFEQIVRQRQPVAATVAAGLYMRSGQIYKASGRAPDGFKQRTPNVIQFQKSDAPDLIFDQSRRSLNYFTQQVVKEELPMVRMQNLAEQIAQETFQNTQRELVVEEAWEDDYTYTPPDENLDEVEYRYEPRADNFDEDDAEAESVFSDDDWEPAHQERPVVTNVRAQGCEFCKLMALYTPEGKRHRNCSCTDLPNWAETVGTTEQPEWMNQVEDQAYEARKFLMERKLPITTANVAKAIRNGDADKLLAGDAIPSERNALYTKQSQRGRRQQKKRDLRAEEKAREADAAKAARTAREVDAAIKRNRR